MACRLTVEVGGQAVTAGLATRLTVFGTAAVGCSQVRVTAATAINSPPLFQAVVTVLYPPPSTSNPSDPANDGRFVAEFDAPGSGTACEMPIFVSVECVADPACRLFAWRPVKCKVDAPGGGGTGDPNDPGNTGGTDNGNGWDWPFDGPPSIVCPIWGRVFVNMLWPAMAAIVTGLSFLLWPVAAGGLLLFAGAMAWFRFWSTWCAPPTCGVYRAWAWVLKRCTALALSYAAAQQMFMVPNVWAWLLVPALGVLVGWFITGLRRRRCSIPASTDSVQQLQLW